MSGPIALFDLKVDPGESRDVAAEHPDVAKTAEALMASARTDSPLWPTKGRGAKTRNP